MTYAEALIAGVQISEDHYKARIATLEAELEQCLAMLKAIHDGHQVFIEDVPAWMSERLRAVPAPVVKQDS